MAAAALIGALVVAAVAIWLRGRRQSPPHSGRADSDLREALVGLLLTVGPFFGVRYRPPRVENPAVTAPAGDLDPQAPAGPGDVEGGRQADPP